MYQKLRRGIKFMMLAGLGVVLWIAIINIWVEATTSFRIYTASTEIPSRNLAVVLGTSKRVTSGHLNGFFTTRMDAAAELYHAGKVKKILVSGDNSIKEYDEPSDMRNALIQRGVPDSDIVSDYAGFRTFDSVIRSRDVFGQDSVIFVSQKFHCQRAIFIARNKGIHALGYVADNPGSSHKYFMVRIREWLARVKAFLDCFLLGTKPKFPGPPEPINF